MEEKMSNSLKEYQDYLRSSQSISTGKLSSYVLVISKIGKIVKTVPGFEYVPDDFSVVKNLDLIYKVYQLVCEEQRKEDGGIFRDSPIRKSYWDVRHGFCSAAVRDFLNYRIKTYGGPISQDVLAVLKEPAILPIDAPRQLITFGAPGTGKSHQTEAVVKLYADTVRTTFHPDSDYATFVGCYKPTMEKKPKYDSQGLPIKASGVEVTEEVITYAYVPQAFTKAYVRAWKKMAEPGADGKVEPQFLVIEEINRGNCAQIFGDLFQLLDRDDEGYSKYSIEADSDLGKFIADTMSEWPAAMQAHIPDEVRSGKKMVLPPNFYIWATMNTSDQSLFPIDSAFKRRWDWQYIPIRNAGMGWKIRVEAPGGGEDEVSVREYDWWTFLAKINERILRATQSEDKQLGYFFAKPDKGGDAITEGKFVNKVLFYLYNDAFKDYDLPEGFEKPGDGKFAFKDFFLADGKPNGRAVAELLDVLLGNGE